MTRRNPNIRIHRHSLSLLNEPERVRATRRGEVIHYALGLLGRAEESGLERMWSMARGPSGTRGRSGASDDGRTPHAGGTPDSRLAQRIEASVIKAFAALNLDPGRWNISDDFVKPLARAFRLAEFRAWFDCGVISLREAEIMDAAGDVYRPDRIVLRDGRTEVIDFKVGKREDAHRQQVRTYVELLAGVFEGKPAAGYLVYIDEPAIVEVR